MVVGSTKDLNPPVSFGSAACLGSFSNTLILYNNLHKPGDGYFN